MTDMNPLACSPEYQKLREQYETLVADYTALVSQYQEMTDHEAPHLSALYMHYFGKLLYTQLRLGLSLATLRFRRSLLQAYINRDEAPDLAEIDKQMAQQRQSFISSWSESWLNSKRLRSIGTGRTSLPKRPKSSERSTKPSSSDSTQTSTHTIRKRTSDSF